MPHSMPWQTTASTWQCRTLRWPGPHSWCSVYSTRGNMPLQQLPMSEAHSMVRKVENHCYRAMRKKGKKRAGYGGQGILFKNSSAPRGIIIIYIEMLPRFGYPDQTFLLNTKSLLLTPSRIYIQCTSNYHIPSSLFHKLPYFKKAKPCF